MREGNTPGKQLTRWSKLLPEKGEGTVLHTITVSSIGLTQRKRIREPRTSVKLEKSRALSHCSPSIKKDYGG